MNTDEKEIELESTILAPENKVSSQQKIVSLFSESNSDVVLKCQTSHYVSFPSMMRSIVEAGIQKCEYPLIKMIGLSIMGGMLLSVGGLMSINIGNALPSSELGISKFVFGACFSIGLILVVFTQSELFTSNCATLIPTLLERKIKWYFVIKSLITTYFGNLIGSIFVAVMFGKVLGSFDNKLYIEALIKIGEAKVQLDFGRAILSGIGCNWVVCTAVILSFSSKDVIGKVAILSIFVMTFVSLGFEHSVANMFFLPLAQMYGAKINMLQIVWCNLIPVSFGNIIGGIVFVGIPFWYLHISTIYRIPFIDP
ncbi:hypothetical protein EIN_096040 [Entamoeba invadens IP1]|uniref:Formate transporter n=1 Tax=Entamoeba invadens IP1 TaxID=370355 RepID=A0A0A1U0E1_ENTIV|nr:hypothetical protein EIN_096040 [Entamoeba invadens IP1]ELP87347.1 hypothetical protein EIN_096040 [Entamoeba invadens IP1]|eukprot:XP_004254118.1 hypothetical protein EIN_096040 [Entamoeba invadens IP1]